MGLFGTFYAPLLLLAALASLALAFLSWRRKQTPGSGSLSAMMLAGAWWDVAYALELSGTGPAGRALWGEAKYAGIAAIPVLWLLFALRYTGREGWLTRRRLALLTAEPLLTLAIAFTNPLHHLLRAYAPPAAPGLPPRVVSGPWFWVHTCYSYLLLLAGTALLLSALQRPTRPYRGQYAAVAAGTLAPWFANAIYVFDPGLWSGVDPTPFAFAFTGAAFTWGSLRSGLLDLLPVARRAVVEEMVDGVVVADAKNRVVDLNPAAERMLGRRAQEVVGSDASEVLPSGGVLSRWLGAEGAGRRERIFEGRLARRDCELRVSTLKEKGGVPAGRLLLLRDVTGRKEAERKLRQSEGRFRSVVQNSSEIIKLLGPDGTLRYASPAFGRVLGYDPDESVGMNVFDHVHPDDLPRLADETRKASEEPGGGTYRVEYRFRHAGGSWRWVESTGAHLPDAGELRGVVVNTRDVTERREAEEALRESEGRFRQLFEQSVDALLVHDENGKVVDCNSEACRSLGYSREELLNLSVGDFATGLLSEEERRRRADESLWRRAISAGPGEIVGYHRGRHRRKDGTSFPVEVGVGSIDYAGARMILASARDVTEREAHEEELARRAFHDPLTGLANRALLMDRLSRALSRAERHGTPVAVLFVDLDNFKVLNDSAGHEAGDGLLVAVARRLGRILRPEDTLARLGGDEFVVLLEEGLEGATEVAERVVRELGRPFELAGIRGSGSHVGGAALAGPFATTASIGIALGEQARGPAGQRPQELLKYADRAMYQAKRGGKGRYASFEEAMDARATERLGLEADLRHAVGGVARAGAGASPGEGPHGEFVLHYQPKVRLRTRRIVGVEALVRWRHPERGLLPPERFVPLAEELGLIVPLGRWVAEEACRQVKEWHERFAPEPGGPENGPLLLSVNLSARQLAHPRLFEDLAAVFRKTGFDPRALTLEITESVPVEDAGRAIAALERLKAMGLGLAMDDFGRSYSSLSQLKRLPFDLLKIDRAIVAGVDRDPADAAIVGATVSMARSLGLGVVAEGVETRAEYEKLRSLGCDVGQGSYWWGALPASGLAELLSASYG